MASKTPIARLNDLAMEALRSHDGSFPGAGEALMESIQGDAKLLYALFEPYKEQAIRKLLSKVSMQMRPVKVVQHTRARPNSIDPVAEGRARVAIVANIVRTSYLRTFMIDGQPLGKCTPSKALAWAREKRQQATFVAMVTANLPLDQPIELFRSEEEVAKMYDAASMESEAA